MVYEEDRPVGIDTEGVDLEEGEVVTVLETNIRRERAQLKKAFKAEGKAEGKVEGKAEGRLEEKYEVVKKLGALGEDICKIALVTGLTEDEIKALLSEKKAEEQPSG